MPGQPRPGGRRSRAPSVDLKLDSASADVASVGGSAEQPAGPIARGSDIQLWREWGRLTRFLGSARLAFARERHVLNSLELVNPERAKLAAPMADGVYEVGLDDHLTAIGDEEMLLASVLIHSYALAEWAAADHLGVDARSFDGIEDWGERLLTGNGLGWRRR